MPAFDSNQGSTSDQTKLHATREVELTDHELVLVKNGQRFVFRCAPGEETDLLNQLAVLVQDPASGLDWFDAAMLSHQMGERMSKRLQSLKRH